LNNLLDQSLFSQIGINGNKQQINTCFTPAHTQTQIGDSEGLFENRINYLDDDFQIKKMKSYNDV